MKADVVIGAGWGDEGKGLMTDYLASQYDESIVIRFNGGAQAGHTVQTPDGQIHVFSHFGAGSFNNSHTYLSQFFIVNPILFVREAIQLGFMPKVMIHPDCMITTPFDMMVNQLNPKARGTSVGMGINETIQRHKYLRITMRDLKFWSKETLRSTLVSLRENYTILRLKEMGLELPDYLRNDDIIDQYINEVQDMIQYIGVGKLKPTTLPIIFEGAQGLLLDNDYDIDFGTPSKTGLTNVVTLAKELGITSLDVNYMLRAYMTRHGKGQFPTENPELRYHDETNVQGPFQGKVRFGMFDADLIGNVIHNDMLDRDVSITPRLVITHLDQMPPFVEYSIYEQTQTHDRGDFTAALAMDMGMSFYGESWGPTRKDVKCHSL